ncbi:MAG: NAD(P)H-hydrate dehydratase [Marinifilaceae bacterium]
MKIFRAKQIAKIDAFTIEHEPIASVDLMERAAGRVFDWIYPRYAVEQNFKIFVGPGNNGGDALVIARMLADKKFPVEVYLVKIGNRLSKDCQINLDRLKAQNRVEFFEISEKKNVPWIFPDDIVIDGLFGSGLSRPLDDLAADVVKSINASEAKVIAIDIPSGLFGEDNGKNNPRHIIRADVTLSFQFPKLSFFLPENETYVGDWEVLSIDLHPDIIEQELTPYGFLNHEFVKSLLMKRHKFDHKGTYGHGLLISGSYGKMGAAILSSRACLRTGLGLLTSHIPRLGYAIMQTAVPEAMVSIDRSDIIFTEFPDLSNFQAVAIGPGLDKKQNSFKALAQLMDEVKVPMVFDADAINIIGEHQELIDRIPAGSVFTPHPKEFERLVGPSKDHYTRNQMQIEFARKHGVTVVLKGAHTAIACPDGSCYFNTTGNPGMATAGSGDVLTGIVLSLLAQGYSSHLAAIIGVYLHGVAGDLVAAKMGEEALIAGDLVDYLGKAWCEIKK